MARNKPDDGLIDAVEVEEAEAPHVPMTFARSSRCSNSTTMERADDVVPRVVTAVIELLTAGQIWRHKEAIRRHLPERALDQAIERLERLRGK